MGTAFGAVAFASMLCMAVGPLFGGWVYDASGSYAWPFIGSAGIGLGAVAIAATFQNPPPARDSPNVGDFDSSSSESRRLPVTLVLLFIFIRFGPRYRGGGEILLSMTALGLCVSSPAFTDGKMIVLKLLIYLIY